MATYPANSLCEEVWNTLSRMRSPASYAAGESLFRYGDPARGLYMVEKGTVNLLLSGEREQLFESVGPGALLGLSEAISGGAHKLTAVAANQVEVAFIPRQDLLNCLRENPACCMQLVRRLSENLHTLYQRFQSDKPGQAKAPRGEVSRQRWSGTRPN